MEEEFNFNFNKPTIVKIIKIHHQIIKLLIINKNQLKNNTIKIQDIKNSTKNYLY